MSKVQALMQFLDRAAQDRMNYLVNNVFIETAKTKVDEKAKLVKAFQVAEYQLLSSSSKKAESALNDYLDLAAKSADHTLVFSHLTQLAVRHGEFIPTAAQEASIVRGLEVTSQRLLIGASDETIAVLNDGARSLSGAYTQAFKEFGQSLDARINGPKIPEQRGASSAPVAEARL